jgi:hypothetical protein
MGNVAVLRAMQDDYQSPGLKRGDIDELLYNWVYWLQTRRFYAPPVPPNMLMLMQVDRRGLKEPPNARNDAISAAFNIVLQGADVGYRLPFLYVYLKQFRPEPIKTLAFNLGIDRDTVYQRAHIAAENYYNQALKLADMNSKFSKEVDDNAD